MQRYDDLLIFVRVVERGSFIAAARQLALPATTVSRKVQELEARLGIQLLRRTTRRLQVTETGQAVYESAARGFAEIEEAEAFARGRHDEPSGVLRVTMPHAFARLQFEPWLPEFIRRYPKIRLELLLASATLDLLEYGCDVAIRAGPQSDSSYIKRSLYRSGLSVVASPTYLARVERPRSPRELVDHPIALTSNLLSRNYGPQVLPSLYTFERDGKYEEVIFAPILAVNDPDVLVPFALEGVGISVVFELMSRAYVASGALENVFSDWRITAELEMSILYTPRATMESKVKVFVDFMLEKLKDQR
ncbi:MAG: LysR family transcriptional regulator [Beijerinckiaceae bacterium]